MQLQDFSNGIHLCTIFIYSFENESRYCIESAIENVSFSKERLLIIRALITWFYTMLWSIVGVVWIVFSIPNTFELYNWPTLAIHLSYYVTF